MSRTMWRAPGMLLAIASAASTLEGQTSPRWIPSWEVGATSRHVWRGVTRFNGLAGQAMLGLTRSGKDFDLSVSGWGTLAGRCDLCARTVADLSLSGTATWHSKVLDFTGGVSHYRAQPAPWDLADSSGRTTELLVSLASRPSRHALISVAAYLDVGAVKGTYFEASATVPFTLVQGTIPKFFLFGTLGVNGGQTQRPGVPGYFAERGPVFGALQVNWIPWSSANACTFRGSVQLFVRFQGNFDQATRQRSVSDPRTGEQRVWVGMMTRGSFGKVVPPDWCRLLSILRRT